MPLTNEQRAHDLAISVLSTEERENVLAVAKEDGFTNSDNYYSLYSEAYKMLYFNFKKELDDTFDI